MVGGEFESTSGSSGRDTRTVSHDPWEDLSHIEQCFLVNAFEFDILFGAVAALTDDEQDLPLSELAAILLGLIDRGWIEMCRYVPDRELAIRDALKPGDVIPRHDVPALLADPQTWEPHKSFEGAPALILTEAGYQVWRRPSDS
jgi:hypothetical protein